MSVNNLNLGRIWKHSSRQTSLICAVLRTLNRTIKTRLLSYPVSLNPLKGNYCSVIQAHIYILYGLYSLGYSNRIPLFQGNFMSWPVMIKHLITSRSVYIFQLSFKKNSGINPNKPLSKPRVSRFLNKIKINTSIIQCPSRSIFCIWHSMYYGTSHVNITCTIIFKWK